MQNLKEDIIKNIDSLMIIDWNGFLITSTME